MSITTINLGKIRVNWRGVWTTSTAYQINDAVSNGGSSYICVVAHTSGTFATDLAAVDWQIMAQGQSTNTTTGDITYYGASSNQRLAVGQTGQVLTVSGGVPAWAYPNVTGAVFYVTPEGSDANSGTSMNNAWASLQKACSTVTGPATIFVKAGTYSEILPITVPSNVTIVGDGMRDTKIQPKVASTTATYNATGSSGTTVKVSSTSSIQVGMTVTGTGFTSAQKVSQVVDSLTIVVSANPDTTPSGTLTFTFKSIDASPVLNNLSTMFLLSDQSMVQGLLLTGMTGFTSGSPANDITAATIGGVYFRLNPSSTITKSPYVKDVTAQSTGGVGAIIDGTAQASGNKSIVFWAFNCILDLGVGLWAKDGGRVEAVSVFTYYCYFGYATTGGGKIRSLSGNNSYGQYGAVSRGYDSTEAPVTGTVYGNMLTINTISLVGTFQVGETITQATSGATGTVTSVQTGYIYYKSTSGTFNGTNVITGGTSGATATVTAATGQANYLLVLSGLTAAPTVGASLQFTNGADSGGAYVIQATSGGWVNTGSVVTITLAQQKVTPSVDAATLQIRYNFSQVRLTGHDFLNVGTGSIATTNYPGIPSQTPAPANQTVNVLPGRVYYVATDQDGNFSVGQYFSVNQATGAATLNASAFNLSGLTSLRLGSIGAQLGAQVDEFSTDGTLSANSATKVPTQSAVRTYLGAAYQNFTPATDLTYDLGTASKRWRSLYVGAGSITLGTVVLSDVSGTLTVGGSSNMTVPGNLVVTGTTTLNGATTYVQGSNTVYTDNMIELHAPTGGVGGTWGSSDGKDIGLRLHYYSAADKNAALVLSNSSGYLEWFVDGTETSGVFSGTYGTIKAATFLATSGVNTSAVITSGSTFNLATTNATTVNEYSAATSIAVAASAGSATTWTLGNATYNNILNIRGTLSVAGSSTGSVRFVAQAAAGSATYTLPNALPGTAGFALVSDLSGNLSWAAAGAALATDTSTTLYPTMSTTTTGNFTAAKVNTNLTFNGTTGVLTTSGGFVESSSITLKENVMPITNALDIILQLCGVTYDRKDGSKKNEPGLIAERVAEIADNLVMRDDNGNPTGIYYTKISAYLVEAIKGLHSQIDPLKEEIRKLKGE